MSLYLGTNGNKLLHITEGTTELENIKVDYALTSTVFHSSLPYIQPLRFSCQVYNYVWSDKYGKYCHMYIKPSDEAINLLIEGYEFTIIAKTNNSGSEWVNSSTHIDISRYDSIISDTLSYSTNLWNSSAGFNGSSPGSTINPTQSNKWLWLFNKNRYGLSSGTYYMPYSVFNYGDRLQDAYILVYNIKNGSVTSQINSLPTTIKSIDLTPTSFTINNGAYNIDLSKFTSLKQISFYDGVNGFRSINGSSKTFLSNTVIPTTIGWNLYPNNISYNIDRITTTGTDTLFTYSNPISLLLSSTTLLAPSYISFGEGSAEYTLGTIEKNSFIYAKISGSLYLPTTGNVPFYIKSTIRTYNDNAWGIVLVGDAYSYKGGVNRQSLVFLWLGIFNGVIKLRVEHYRGYAATSGPLRFSISNLQLDLLKFYTRVIN